MLALFFLFLPAYALALIFFSLNTLVAPESGQPEGQAKQSVFSKAAWGGEIVWRLVWPFALILPLGLLCARGYEGSIFFSQLVLTKGALHALAGLSFLGISGLWAFLHLWLPTTGSALADVAQSALLLIVSFGWALLSGSFPTLLITLELITLALLWLLLASTELKAQPLSQVNWAWQSTGAEGRHYGAAIVMFVWVSALASLAMMWALGSSGSLLTFWNPHQLPLYQPSGALWGGALLVGAFLLKLGCAPFHFWLLGAYRLLPFPALLAYMVFYYFYSLGLVFYCLVAFLPPVLSGSGLGCLCVAFLLTAGVSLRRAGDSTTLGGLLAVSSIVNIALLWLLFVSAS